MPPRFAYWTILVGGLPTAFRAAERDEIEPTFRRLKQKHPDAEMRWFARGKLWASPAEASEALSRQKAEGTRPKDGFGERRGREWRPGGSHRDPRQGYIDAKKRENQRKRERRFEFKQGSRPQATGSRPHEERPAWKRPAGAEGPESEKRWKPQSRPGAWSPKPGAPASKPSWKPKPKPWRGPEPGARSPESRDRRPETGDRRPPKTEDRRPKTDRPWSPKPPGSGQPRGRWAGKGHGPRGPKR